jgi:hypothetical protein
MPSRIVTSTYRYSPPRKRKTLQLEGRRSCESATAQIAPDAAPRFSHRHCQTPAGQVRRRARHDLGSRGDAADALFREMVRRAAGKN